TGASSDESPSRVAALKRSDSVAFSFVYTYSCGCSSGCSPDSVYRQTFTLSPSLKVLYIVFLYKTITICCIQIVSKKINECNLRLIKICRLVYMKHRELSIE